MSIDGKHQRVALLNVDVDFYCEKAAAVPVHCEACLSLEDARQYAQMAVSGSARCPQTTAKSWCRCPQRLDEATKLVYRLATGQGYSKGTATRAQPALYELAVRLRDDGVDAELLAKVFKYLKRFYMKRNNLPSF